VGVPAIQIDGGRLQADIRPNELGDLLQTLAKGVFIIRRAVLRLILRRIRSGQKIESIENQLPLLLDFGTLLVQNLLPFVAVCFFLYLLCPIAYLYLSSHLSLVLFVAKV